MINLLRLDFRKLFHDKIFIIGSIIYLFVSVLMGYALSSVDGVISSNTTLTYIKSCFSLMNYGSVLIFIFMTVHTTKDFSQGTIRNKIVAGYSRAKIYFSSLVVSVCVLFVLFLTTSGISTLINIGKITSSAPE
jgi:hypothetical protein